MSATTLRPRRVGEILDAGIKIYVRHARTLMGLAAVVVVPMQIVAAIVLLSTLSSGSAVPSSAFGVGQSTSDRLAALGGQLTLLVVQFVATALVTAACVKAVSDAYLDQPTGIGLSLRFGLRRLGGVIGLEILMGLGLVLGFIALIIPGVWLYAAWSVSLPALLIERVRPARALGRSRRLVKGRWWPTAGVLLVAYLMGALVGGALEAALVGIAGLHNQPNLVLAVVVTTLAGAIASILVTPFRAAVTTILYYDLRVRREGYDLHLLADQLGLPASVAQERAWAGDEPAVDGEPLGPESVGRPGGPPFWPPPPGWRPSR